MTPRRGVFAWMLFDWANQPFQALIVTFIFAPWFVAEVIGDPARGQALWGAAAAIAGAIVAILAPFLGAMADLTGARKRWILACSVPFVLGCAGFWLATPGMPNPGLILVIYAVAFIGSELGQVFINAMLPGLGPRRRDRPHLRLRLGARLPRRARLPRPRPPLPRPRPGQDHDPPRHRADPRPRPGARRAGPRHRPPLRRLVSRLRPPPLPLHPRRTAAAAPPASPAPPSPTSPPPSAWRGAHRSFFAFLVASMIYRDALAALFTFGGIFAAGVLGWGLFELGVFGIVAAGVGAIGAWAGGRADRAFGPRPVIVASIWALIAVGVVALLTTRASVLGFPVAPGLAAARRRLHGGGRPPRRRRRRAAGRLAHPPRPPGRRPGRPGPGLRPLRPLRPRHRLHRPRAHRRSSPPPPARSGSASAR